MFSPQTVILENSPDTRFENDQTRSNRAPVEPSRIQNVLNALYCGNDLHKRKAARILNVFFFWQAMMKIMQISLEIGKDYATNCRSQKVFSNFANKYLGVLPIASDDKSPVMIKRGEGVRRQKG